MSDTITLTAKQYLYYVMRDSTLQMLEDGGVDSWSGMDFAKEEASSSFKALRKISRNDPNLSIEMIDQALFTE